MCISKGGLEKTKDRTDVRDARNIRWFLWHLTAGRTVKNSRYSGNNTVEVIFVFYVKCHVKITTGIFGIILIVNNKYKTDVSTWTEKNERKKTKKLQTFLTYRTYLKDLWKALSTKNVFFANFKNNNSKA